MSPAARDLAFLDELVALLLLERDAQAERLAAGRAALPIADREARGLLARSLVIVDVEAGLGGRSLVSLERRDRADIPLAAGVGDVLEARHHHLPDEPPLRAIVARRTRSRLVIALERPAQELFGPDPGPIDLEPSPDDVTYERAKGALVRLAAMDRGIARRRRDLYLGVTPPRRSRLEAFEPTRPLNPEQRDAVAQALAADELLLVHGPPGTGKSTVLVEIAAQAVARGQRVLCAAPSNAAVDHLLDLCLAAGLPALRIGHPARVAERLQAHTLDLEVERNPDRQVAKELLERAWELFGYSRRQRDRGRSPDWLANAEQARAEGRRLLDEAHALERRAVAHVLSRARVVCATCAAVESSTLASERFDLLLLDEATQAVEPVALLPWLRAPRTILAGDPRQLPPTVVSQEAARRGLSVSLFERLLADHGEGIQVLLREQHRMHEAIMAFPSRELYGGELRAHPAAAGRTLAELLAPGVAIDAPPVLFLDTAGKGLDDRLRPGTESHENPGEAELVVARARALCAAGLPPEQLGVIAPYRAQALLLREELPEGVEVDTVDAFQGREKEAILVSLTRSNPEGAIGFLADLRRMNVAITRARRHLFIVGDSATLGGHPFYRRFFESAEAGGGYRSAWEWREAEAP